jgi:large conductance mechanosensitive channel
MLKEFRDFIARGNVLDLAVGVILGLAFGKIVTTLVDGIIMPPIGVLLGNIDFSNLFIVLDRTRPAEEIPQTLKAAADAGVPVIAYGRFVNDVLNFLIVAGAVFLMVKQVNRIKSSIDQPLPAAAPTTKECPFCASTISIKATRCPNCTSQL